LAQKIISLSSCAACARRRAGSAGGESHFIKKSDNISIDLLS
jgi:hypothetical protein